METKMEEMKTKEVRNILAEGREREVGRKKLQIKISNRGPPILASRCSIHPSIHLSIHQFIP